MTEDSPSCPVILLALILTILVGLGLAQVIPDSDELMKHYNPQPDWSKLGKR